MIKKFDIDIIIISYKGFALTKSCIESIYSSVHINPNIIIVDNNSPDDSISNLKQAFPEITYIINDRNYGYAKAVNIGVASSYNNYILISNNDVEFQYESIYKLIETLENNSNIAAVSAQQSFPNYQWQSSSGFNPSLKLAFYKFLFIDLLINKILKFKYNHHLLKGIKNVDYIDGAAILTKKEVFNKLNGFDESFFFYSEEADFCIKCHQKNLRTVINYDARIIHHRGAGSNGNLNISNIDQLIKSKMILIDKYLNSFDKKIYIYSELFQNSILVLLLRFINIFIKSESFIKKINIFKSYLNAWKKIK